MRHALIYVKAATKRPVMIRLRRRGVLTMAARRLTSDGCVRTLQLQVIAYE